MTIDTVKAVIARNEAKPIHGANSPNWLIAVQTPPTAVGLDAANA